MHWNFGFSNPELVAWSCWLHLLLCCLIDLLLLHLCFCQLHFCTPVYFGAESNVFSQSSTMSAILHCQCLPSHLSPIHYSKPPEGVAHFLRLQRRSQDLKLAEPDEGHHVLGQMEAKCSEKTTWPHELNQNIYPSSFIKHKKREPPRIAGPSDRSGAECAHTVLLAWWLNVATVLGKCPVTSIHRRAMWTANNLIAIIPTKPSIL